VVGSQILIFFSSWGGGTAPQTPPLLLNILAFFIETHPKQSQHDVSLQMYYCASSVSLDARVLAGLGEFPVESNEMAMKRMGN